VSLPRLETARLVLRPFTVADAPAVQQHCGDRRIADTTLLIPHPYPDGAAETFIASHRPDFAAGTSATLAVTERAGGAVVGAIGLSLDLAQLRGELGYWIAVPCWNRGYATEAGRAVIAWAFADLGLERVEAHHLVRNPASGRVLQKLGMRQEGVLRSWIVKWGVREDVAVYGRLRSDG
jgi:ribosomal-protein-alanine N-acetyltransferase